jgi:hypothetical protein
MFVMMGILMALTGKAWWHLILGSICIVFFGLGFLVLFRQVIDRRPRITIDELGVTDRTLKVGRIDWGDIIDVELRSINKTSFICLYLVNPNKYTAKLSKISKNLTKANVELGFSQLNLNLSFLDMSPDEVFSLVNDHIAIGSPQL